jgi:hypothetical protein
MPEDGLTLLAGRVPSGSCFPCGFGEVVLELRVRPLPAANCRHMDTGHGRRSAQRQAQAAEAQQGSERR